MGTQVWHLEDIKAALRKRGGSLQALSRAWGWHPNALSNALRQPGYSAAIERRVARELRVPLHELWPERWDSKGRPVALVGGANRTPARPLAQRQMEKVA